MTAAATVEAQAPARDRVAAWCGWVMVGAAVLIPLVGWLAPLGFAPVLALMGLLCLPAFSIADEDRPVLIVLLGLLVWGAVTTTWSPTHAKDLSHSVILQLALGLPLFWSAICGARRADPRLNALALRILAWALAIYGVELMVETATGAAIFRYLHETYYQPIRVDLAQGKVAHSTFVMAVLWPAVLVGGLRRRWEVGQLILAVAGVVMAAHAFQADAPVLAFPLASIVMLIVWLWPRGGPRLAAAVVAGLTLLMPAVIWAARATGDYDQVERRMPFTWGARMSYWRHAADFIAERPLRGWGLDASRSMGPGFILHPHNGALQVWLELGVIGAVAAAAFWGLAFIRLTRDRPNQSLAGVAGSAAAFLLFAWTNYGLWQQWWLALGAFVAVLAEMLSSRDLHLATGERRPQAQAEEAKARSGGVELERC